ncbi:MAG: MFS transporter [SAR202 cluster bacterium]|jgi:predicted MFS family arabinose efflux permease|nr:MFS transporter [SAR202 cluster bacterium]
MNDDSGAQSSAGEADEGPKPSPPGASTNSPSSTKSQPQSGIASAAGRSNDQTSGTTTTIAGGRSVGSNPSWRETFSSLKEREFMFLWLGMLALMGGMQMQMLARGYLVYDLTGSASLLGVVNAGSSLPMLVLALFGGAIADRMERKRLIQIGQGVAGALSLGVAFAIYTGHIEWWYLMISGLIQGTAWAFMMPARQAIIPQLVGADKLTNAMALNAAGMSVMTLLAPALAGGLYAWAGPDKVYFIIGSLGIIAMIVTSFIRAPAGPQRTRKPAMLRDIGEGLQYIRKNNLVMVLLFIGLATSLLAMPFRFLMPVFVVDVYHLDSKAMGLLIAVMGGGSLVGSLVIAALGNWRRGMLLILGSFASGIALLLLVLFPFYYAAAAIMIILGVGDSTRRTLNQSMMMEVVEDQFRGRVMSVFMMNFGLMPLGVLPTGILADAVGPRFAIGTLAVLLLVITTMVLVTQKQLRSIR